MEQYALSNEEIIILKKYGEKFKKWLKTEDGKKENQDHQDHTNYFKLKLSSENLSKLKKSDLVELYKKLWVSSFWENKDWYITQLIEKNGFDNVKNELYQLLYGTESFEKRYDSFREKIKGFGISAISEILNMVHPENYCLWNDKSKNVLKFLNLRKNLPERLFKYNLLTGEEYSQCKDYLNAIKNELYSFDVKDFVDLDLFFWYIHKNIIPHEWKKDSKLEYDKEEQNELQEEKKNDIINVENIILEYDKNKDVLGKRKITEKEAMKLRSEFISDFPPDKILDIKIDNYVEGKKLDTGEPNRKTFCYRLEFELDGFGNIGGVNAIKFGIYYSPKDKKYVYNEKKFHSAEEAYEKILKQINTLIVSGKQFTQDNDWKKLSDAFERVDAIKSIVKSKILAVYFPDAIVSINSHNGIKQILKSLFHVPDEEIQEEFMLNKEKLWKIQQNHPIMKSWSNFDYSYFVWYTWKNYFKEDELLSIEENSSDASESKTRRFVKLLIDFLKKKYPSVNFIQKTSKSSWIEFSDFGSLLYVNSSKEYENNTGWYDLDNSIYNEIIHANNSFIGVILGKPEKTFIFPKEKIIEIFNDENKLERKDRPRWMFSIFNENNNYFLKIKKEIINVNDYLNRWNLIPDLSNKRNEDNLNLWLVRAGDIGQGEQSALENNCVSIGYGGLPELHHINDFETFKAHYIKTHPNDRIARVGKVVPQIWNFIYEIKIGDFIILPLKIHKSKLIAVGKIVGEYQYENLNSEIQQFRPVKWLKKDIGINEFDPDIIKLFDERGTVYRIGGLNEVNKVKDMLKRLGINEIDLEDINNINAKSIQSKNNENKILLSLDDVCRLTYFPIGILKEIENLLLDKNQIIFYGSPGTSKTFLAKKFAEYFAQGMENIRIIQFHQSYSYEDFIEGIKPKISETGEAIGFKLQSGFFKNLVKECIENPAKRFVLIIDEINRGNISKIFGELIYLLEYRNEKISLTYSPNEKFYIPSNLYIIGTMNSADRSIAFVDYALRRRFYFKEFYPDTNGDVLYSWYKDNNITEVDPHQIVTLLNEINKKISEQIGREYQIGYSYFMVKNLDKKKLKNIIDYAITPLIEQYFFGKKQKVEEIKQIWSTIFNINTSNFQTSTI